MLGRDGPFLQPSVAVRRIEQRAMELLQKCKNELGIRETPLPVPVDLWIEHPLGYEFGVSDLSHLGPNVLGASYIKEREILIDEKVLQHDGRYRFTCAHELAHMTLHSKVRKVFQETGSAPGASGDRYEKQADRFAAAFLMPVPLLVRELFRIADELKLDRAPCITELMMNTTESEWLWKKRFLPALTKRFGVSLSAAVFRFSDIRLRDGKAFLPERLRASMFVRPEADSPIRQMRLVGGFPVRPGSAAT